VLYVGRLSREKGIPTLLAAMRELPIPLAIVGDGPMRDTLEMYVRQHAMAHRVTFHGYQTGQSLRQLYQGAAFLVIPSEWYENAPMTVLEAFAYGKPVIGARIGGIPEMIEPGTSGLLVAPGDGDALRDAINTLWTSRSSLAEMGHAGRQAVLTRFSPQRHVDELLALYRRAIAA
jgi:glycosyltransferase involved in cell wall biosynthesis